MRKVRSSEELGEHQTRRKHRVGRLGVRGGAKTFNEEVEMQIDVFPPLA